jgi:hypothetical protein
MGWWLAGAGDALTTGFVKRFEPRFWTVNFPRPMMAAVTTIAADALRVDAVFYKADDLAGLIWEAEDIGQRIHVVRRHRDGLRRRRAGRVDGIREHVGHRMPFDLGGERGAPRGPRGEARTARRRKPSANAQEAANFISLIASELLTPPPTRLVA